MVPIFTDEPARGQINRAIAPLTTPRGVDLYSSIKARRRGIKRAGTMTTFTKYLLSNCYVVIERLLIGLSFCLVGFLIF